MTADDGVGMRRHPNSFPPYVCLIACMRCLPSLNVLPASAPQVQLLALNSEAKYYDVGKRLNRFASKPVRTDI